MRDSYIDYAMSVIVARALPDVRDGLKPVHRRILYSMNELNLDPTKAYKKSARIVGDTMGKYHPHGESSIYDAMVRMAQDFSMRYMLVDGHGNFGSMDGDAAAAQRYTEARLSRISMEMLADIEKETVDFIPNYDGEFKEPVVLPSRFPNLLVNGSSGIAVGMATNIPPHNLGECIDALVLMIDNTIEDNDTDINDIISIIKGPDFPTGGSILGTNGIKQAYRTGRGKILVRAQAQIEPMGHDREMIVVTELPYQVNKAKLVERMAELVKEKRVEGITDIRDESNRTGVRIVIELKKDANSNVILNLLYKNSSLQESFGVIMLALCDNEPKILNIKELLEHYLVHQREVVRRRTIFDLNRAEKRAHILQGYLIALDHIDEVIAIIRGSQDSRTARTRLSERFGLSDEQAEAIVDMRLRNLTGLERDRIEKEFTELQQLIKELTAILQDEKKLIGVIKDELLVIRQKYADERRTQIMFDTGEIDIEDLINEETSVITMTHLDYIKRIPLSAYKSQNRGGKGVIGMQMRDSDIIKNMFVASTHDHILFFTNHGRAYQIKAYVVPEAGRNAKGLAIVNLLNLNGGEKIAAVIPVESFEESVIENESLVMVTKMGIVKKIALKHFGRINKAGLNALNIKEDDELIAVLRVKADQDIFIATNRGMGIRFGEHALRAMGRAATGVKSILLGDGDKVVGAGIISNDYKLLFVSANGYGKCTDAEEFRLQGRRGKGLKIYKITDKTGEIIGVCPVNEREEVMLINSDGVIIRIKVSDISTQGRITQGVRLIKTDNGIQVVGVTKIAEDYLTDEESTEYEGIVDEAVEDEALNSEGVQNTNDEDIDSGE